MPRRSLVKNDVVGNRRHWLSITLLLVATLATGSVAAQEPAGATSDPQEKLLRGELLEISSGDLDGAMAIYEELQAQEGLPEEIRARALLCLARCHRKRGDLAKARRLLDRLVAQHRTQGEVLREAQVYLRELERGESNSDTFDWLGQLERNPEIQARIFDLAMNLVGGGEERDRAISQLLALGTISVPVLEKLVSTTSNESHRLCLALVLLKIGKLEYVDDVYGDPEPPSWLKSWLSSTAMSLGDKSGAERDDLRRRVAKLTPDSEGYVDMMRVLLAKPSDATAALDGLSQRRTKTIPQGVWRRLAQQPHGPDAIFAWVGPNRAPSDVRYAIEMLREHAPSSLTPQRYVEMLELIPSVRGRIFDHIIEDKDWNTFDLLVEAMPKTMSGYLGAPGQGGFGGNGVPTQKLADYYVKLGSMRALELLAYQDEEVVSSYVAAVESLPATALPDDAAGYITLENRSARGRRGGSRSARSSSGARLEASEELVAAFRRWVFVDEHLPRQLAGLRGLAQHEQHIEAPLFERMLTLCDRTAELTSYDDNYRTLGGAAKRVLRKNLGGFRDGAGQRSVDQFRDLLPRLNPADHFQASLILDLQNMWLVGRGSTPLPLPEEENQAALIGVLTQSASDLQRATAIHEWFRRYQDQVWAHVDWSWLAAVHDEEGNSGHTGHVLGKLGRRAPSDWLGKQPLAELQRIYRTVLPTADPSVATWLVWGHPSVDVRDPDEIAGLLVGALERDDVPLKVETLERLERLPGPTAKEAAERMLRDPSYKVRMQAVKVLARLGDASAVPTLTKLLDDPRVEVRDEALEGLRQIRELLKEREEWGRIAEAIESGKLELEKQD